MHPHNSSFAISSRDVYPVIEIDRQRSPMTDGPITEPIAKDLARARVSRSKAVIARLRHTRASLRVLRVMASPCVVLALVIASGVLREHRAVAFSPSGRIYRSRFSFPRFLPSFLAARRDAFLSSSNDPRNSTVIKRRRSRRSWTDVNEIFDKNR